MILRVKCSSEQEKEQEEEENEALVDQEFTPGGHLIFKDDVNSISKS